MRLSFIILSIAFAVYGLLPYKRAMNVDTTQPNNIIIERQECGCPCPDAAVTKGRLEISKEIQEKYSSLNRSQINLEISDFNENNNFELWHAKLFLKGQVVGADTILCSATECELAPKFKVASWRLIDTIPNAFIFSIWFGIIFLINLFLILPFLVISEIVFRYKKYRNSKNGS